MREPRHVVGRGKLKLEGPIGERRGRAAGAHFDQSRRAVHQLGGKEELERATPVRCYGREVGAVLIGHRAADLGAVDEDIDGRRLARLLVEGPSMDTPALYVHKTVHASSLHDPEKCVAVFGKVMRRQSSGMTKKVIALWEEV